MEDEIIQPLPYPVAGPAQYGLGNGYNEVYPYERTFVAEGGATGSIYVKNLDYLLTLFDAAAFRVTAIGDMEFLVDDPEGGNTLVWLDITELDIPEPTAH